MTTNTTDVADILLQARSRLIHRKPWYGTFVASMDWKPSNMEFLPPHARTMGVYIKQGGKIGCIYNPAWCATKNIKQLYGIIQHEVEHIVRLHPLRCGSRNPDGWNIAADMTVNGKRSNVRIGYEDNNKIIFPTENAIFIPETWDESLSAEQFYALLEKNATKKQCPQCGRTTKTYNLGDDPKGGKGDKDDKSGKGDKGEKGKGSDPGDGEGGEGEGEGECKGSGNGNGGCSGCGQELDGKSRFGGMEGETLDSHGTWSQSDAPEDEARQYVKELTRRATAKARGKAPAHLKDAIEALEKPIVRWRELLRMYLGKHCGNKRHTYARRNRRFKAFGIKGESHHAAATATVIIDTSGSISKDELQQFFAEIEGIISRTVITLIQADAAVHHCAKYRRGDWKTIEVKGRGGTDMRVPFKYIEDNKISADVVILLTDGETPWPDDHGYPVIFVITRNTNYYGAPTFGHIVRLEKYDSQSK